jgi:hypothetical protein
MAPAPLLVAASDKPAEPDQRPGLVLLAVIVCGILLWIWHRRGRAQLIAAGEPLPPKGWRRFKRPAWLLAVLAPFIPESYAGAMPPQIFFFPLVTVYLVMFYGTAAILIREITLAWKKGWPTVLAMGAAYGICEEGLGTKVFFDPGRTEMGPQLSSGTWFGVHVPYTVHLMVIHAVFSIAIPIFLTTLLFPEQAATPWVRRRTLPVLGALFVAAVLFGGFVIYPYQPSAVIYAGAIGGIVGLIALARVLPRSITSKPALMTTPKRLVARAFGIMFVFFFVSYMFPGLNVPPGVTLTCEILIVIGWAWTAMRIKGTDYTYFAFIAGLLSFFVFTSFVLLVAGSFLQPVVSLAGGWALIWMGRRLRARGPTQDIGIGQGPNGGVTDGGLRWTVRA